VAAEISRQAAFGNLWAELNRYPEILRRQNAPETAFLEEFSNLLLHHSTAGNNTDGLAAPASWRVPPKQVDLANGACKLFGASNLVRDLIGAGLILPIAGASIGENVR